MRKAYVYVSGPISSDPFGNMVRGMETWNKFWGTGLILPFIPQLSVIQNLHHWRPHDEWLEYDLGILPRFDALFRLPGESVGADKEVAFCMERGIPVFYDEEKLFRWANLLAGGGRNG